MPISLNNESDINNRNIEVDKLKMKHAKEPSNKHKESVHKGENHRDVDHTCEECIYRTNL